MGLVRPSSSKALRSGVERLRSLKVTGMYLAAKVTFNYRKSSFVKVSKKAFGHFFLIRTFGEIQFYDENIGFCRF